MATVDPPSEWAVFVDRVLAQTALRKFKWQGDCLCEPWRNALGELTEKWNLMRRVGRVCEPVLNERKELTGMWRPTDVIDAKWVQALLVGGGSGDKFSSPKLELDMCERVASMMLTQDIGSSAFPPISKEELWVDPGVVALVDGSPYVSTAEEYTRVQYVDDATWAVYASAPGSLVRNAATLMRNFPLEPLLSVLNRHKYAIVVVDTDGLHPHILQEFVRVARREMFHIIERFRAPVLCEQYTGVILFKRPAVPSTPT
jgi:hypothetical protein